MGYEVALFPLILFSELAIANDTTGYDSDPYLKYRPPFARSLPVQILLTGIVLTLVAVLFIHLVFTATYHWSLAPVNYVLQLAGVVTLLISLTATIHVVFSSNMTESTEWPYMLSYIAVNVPPVDTEENGWTLAERATWLVMNALTSSLIQITHIHFLTLLYPSRLEARLILALLAPLAVLAAIMQLIPINSTDQVSSFASAVRNVCNATLSIIFTISLFLWGFLVNRKQAWRMDGGTAAFGCAALTLALISTALTILYVPREEEYIWLPGLIWAVILWQSFLGWWWWVGSGSGATPGDHDTLEKRARQRAKRERSRRERREARARAQSMYRAVTGAFRPGPAVRHVKEEQDEHDTSTTTSCSSTTKGGFFLLRWFSVLRHAHLTAAREQAAERSARIREMERTGVADAGHRGWGRGSVGWRFGNNSEAQGAYEMDVRHGRSDEDESSSDGNATIVQQSAQSSESSAPHNQEAARQRRPPGARDVKLDNTEPAARGGSLWWWGPLGRWRLQDSTTY